MRSGPWPALRVFAFDHRSQLEAIPGATPAKIGQFKTLCLQAALAVPGEGRGILCDGRLGHQALAAADGSGLWIGRPVEWPGSRPLTLEPEIGPAGDGLAAWPRAHVVKCLCFCHPDDDVAMWDAQAATLSRLFAAARRHGLDILLEVIPSKCGPVDDETTARLIDKIYALGLSPDWWKLEPLTTDAAWAAAVASIARHDPNVSGIVVLGLDAAEADLAASFAVAARQPLVKGFAVGRTIFGRAAKAWMAGEIGDDAAVDEMAENYQRLCAIWDKARATV